MFQQSMNVILKCKIMGFFDFLFKKNKEVKAPEIKLSDVKGGDCVFIEYYEFKHNQGMVKVLNNDPKNKVIWVQIKWRNVNCDEPEIKRLILPYNSIHLKNFVLLNSVKVEKVEDLLRPDFDKEIMLLTFELKTAISDDDFEKASMLRDKIAKLKKEKKR